MENKISIYLSHNSTAYMRSDISKLSTNHRTLACLTSPRCQLVSAARQETEQTWVHPSLNRWHWAAHCQHGGLWLTTTLARYHRCWQTTTNTLHHPLTRLLLINSYVLKIVFHWPNCYKCILPTPSEDDWKDQLCWTARLYDHRHTVSWKVSKLYPANEQINLLHQ